MAMIAVIIAVLCFMASLFFMTLTCTYINVTQKLFKMGKRNEGMGKHNEKIVQWLCFLAMGFFVLWGLQTIFTKNTEFIFDRFFAAALVILGWKWRKELQLNWKTALLGLATLALHHLKLYGNAYAGIPFDRIMHAAAGFTLAVLSYKAIEHESKNHWKTAVLALFLAFGIASSIEIIEFIGYGWFGKGEGLLFYGTGDIGEYNNVAWDLISNMVGA